MTKYKIFTCFLLTFNEYIHFGQNHPFILVTNDLVIRVSGKWFEMCRPNTLLELITNT